MTVLNSSSLISSGGVAFGTSGARGLVTDFTPEICAAFTHAFVAVMRREFEVAHIAIAIDNRPSSYEMAQACAVALMQVGIEPVYYGVIPTPALAYQAMQDNMPCIMVTGSHIPFDRNGLKFYRPGGEITKDDELAILSANVYFSSCFKLPQLMSSSRAAESYCSRYRSLFSPDLLTGKRIGIYEHSSAGRDLYAPLFESLGAEVVRIGRSNEFVPIDTEAVSEEDKNRARLWSREHHLDAIFSTDGDGDRPLLADEKGEWLRGDILGLLCADALSIEALAVPISCNTSVVHCGRFKTVSLTKIGSPYVIEQFAKLRQEYGRVAGFEANGGFLLGSNIEVSGRLLSALPTRDAVLPALMVIKSGYKQGISNLSEGLPQRFTHSDRLINFPVSLSQKIIEKGKESPQLLLNELALSHYQVESLDLTDGLRLYLDNMVIVHLRPSGNAPELRCYAEANDFTVAHQIVVNVLSAIQEKII